MKHLSESLKRTYTIYNQNEMQNKIIQLLQLQGKNTKARTLRLLSQLPISVPVSKLLLEILKIFPSTNWETDRNAYAALGVIGRKAATDEGIDVAVNALLDKDSIVRISACGTLRGMNEKVATGEVIRCVVNWFSDGKGSNFSDQGSTLEWILSSESEIKALDSEMVGKLNSGVRSNNWIELQDFSSKKMIKMFVETTSAFWLPVCVYIALIQCVAVTVIDKNIIIYGSEGVSVLEVSNLDSIAVLKEAFRTEILELAGDSLEVAQSIQNMTDALSHGDFDDGKLNYSDDHGDLSISMEPTLKKLGS
ncbi:unnamed protein product [Rotaria magnacalcarata]|uniref:HEAT repeat domain-containing protein n=2 Tax=Rotaria magnacalcarata TaxID=392030 RepID=A0A816PNQ6_9BILA|nr:unnamed protein product [Rotaria magnacalcarata]CAF4073635.1 unnamed protein product [Rotaria magnacalcarata]